RAGTTVLLLDRARQCTGVSGRVIEKNPEGHCRLQFSGTANIADALPTLGETPLPPYIDRSAPAQDEADAECYQTVYAQPPGSVAAPTAGLHFTQALLEEIRSRGVQVCFLTLHVGLGTFAPVKTEKLEEHTMHAERFQLSAAAAETINEAKRM